MYASLTPQEIFSPIDVCFARVFAGEDASLTVLLSYLLAMARQGHLCIKVGSKEISPSPSLFCQTGEVALLEEAMRKAFSIISPDLCEEIQSQDDKPSTPFCRLGQQLYLQKNWMVQQAFIQHIRRLLLSSLDSLECPICLENSLNLEQKLAVERALTSPISLISGGPGTGKTFTAAHIVKTFFESLSEEDRSGIQIKLAAPTGKAASLLEKNLQKLLGIIPGLTCGTLHSFIKSENGIAKTLYADILLVDEASMLDARLFVRMLQSLRPGGRLVLMGDKDQLPPVEGGGFFADLIDQSRTLHIPVTFLQTRVRTNSVTLRHLSEAILAQDKKAMELLEGVHVLPSLRSPLLKEHIEEQCRKYFFVSYEEGLDYEAIFHHMERFRILSPLRKGLLGVDAINQRILDLYLTGICITRPIICPILVTKNDPLRNLMNGDSGLLVAKSSSLRSRFFTEEDKVFFMAKEDKKVMEMPASLLPDFSLAYCLSIHKSQGSEYESVTVIAPAGSERFGREVLYTAVTRAKKEVSLWIEPDVLEAVLQKSSRKISGLTF